MILDSFGTRKHCPLTTTFAGGKNSFGNAFTIAAEKTNAHVSHEGFDSTVCKVVAADYERFHENIVLELRQAE